MAITPAQRRALSIIRIACAHPSAPADLGRYQWVLADPRYHTVEIAVRMRHAVAVEREEPPAWEHRTVLIPSLLRDVHGGVRFRVGWDSDHRIAALFSEPFD